MKLKIKIVPHKHGCGCAKCGQMQETITKTDGEYCLKSKKKRNLGCYKTKAGAKKREREVQYFKHKK